MESPLQRCPSLPVGAGAPRAGDNSIVAKPSLSKGQAANLEPCEFTSEMSLRVAGSPPTQAETGEPLLGGGSDRRDLAEEKAAARKAGAAGASPRDWQAQGNCA